MKELARTVVVASSLPTVVDASVASGSDDEDEDEDSVEVTPGKIFGFLTSRLTLRKNFG